MAIVLVIGTMERECYLDNSATTRVFPEVAALMNKIYLEEYGNPSSMHHKGVEAERELRTARETLASILKCEPKNIYFTSCGTEGREAPDHDKDRAPGDP